jgi:hypothetical protein
VGALTSQPYGPLRPVTGIALPFSLLEVITDHDLVDLNWHASLTSLTKIDFPPRKVGRNIWKKYISPTCGIINKTVSPTKLCQLQRIQNTAFPATEPELQPNVLFEGRINSFKF